MRDNLIELSNIVKVYQMGERRLTVLQRIHLSVKRGEFLAVTGPSGSGKSTLLNIIGALDRPDAGEYLFRGRSMLQATDAQLSAFRAKSVGFIFQTFNLVPALNILENVKLPFLYSSVSNSDAKERALNAIEMVGLADRLSHKPSQLSGGEMQRVAIARAIAIRPEMILADEPTGNLDSKTGMEILSLLKDLHNNGVTILMITHDREVASLAARNIFLKDGEIIE